MRTFDGHDINLGDSVFVALVDGTVINSTVDGFTADGRVILLDYPEVEPLERSSNAVDPIALFKEQGRAAEFGRRSTRRSPVFRSFLFELPGGFRVMAIRSAKRKLLLKLFDVADNEIHAHTSLFAERPTRKTIVGSYADIEKQSGISFSDIMPGQYLAVYLDQVVDATAVMFGIFPANLADE